MTAQPEIRRQRHPIRNFIILPDMQWPYIIRMLAMINLAGVLMASTICALFYLRYQGDAEAGADLASEGLLGLLVEENLMDVVIPAFVISDVVSLLIGLWLALYFSRKLSVPIYRVRRWAEAVKGGDLSHRLKFRPGDDLSMLEEACNSVSRTYVDIIEELRRKLSEAESSPRRPENLKSTVDRGP